MIEISKKSGKIILQDSRKKEIIFDPNNSTVFLDGYDVTHPGEYEKSSILLSVKEYTETLFYHFLIDGQNIVIIPNDTFDLKEEILSFFGDVDMLIMIGTKQASKIFENIEAKVVVPYGEGKNAFLTTLGQHIPEVDSYKLKSESTLDATEFVNLSE